MIVELYADQNSMIKVGKIIGDKIFSKHSLDESRYFNAIPRQTIFNIVSKTKIYKPTPIKKETTPRRLYIMADEKYVATQGNDGSKVMVKAAVAFEGLSLKNQRTKYTDKYYHLAITSNFWTEFHEKLSEMYDLDKIDEIFIMGDGATWIKSGTNIFDRGQARFALDRFHLQQALTRITQDKDIRRLLNSYIHANDREGFNAITKTYLKQIRDDRIEKVTEQITYIRNNWNAIQLMEEEIIVGCGMEGTISHTLASIFTSVPKGYRISNLEVYINTRMLHLNGYDLRKVFLKTYDKEEDIITDHKALDYSMFEERVSETKPSRYNYIKGYIWEN